MTRAHISKPILDAAGNVRSGASVRVLQPGTTTPLTGPLFAADMGSSTVTNPFIAANGVVDFYLDTPQRVRIGVTVGQEGEVFFEDVDVPEPAAADSGGGGGAGVKNFYVFDQNSSFSDINGQTIALRPSNTALNTFTQNTDPTVFTYTDDGVGFSRGLRILKAGYCTFSVWVDFESLPAGTILTLQIYNSDLDDRIEHTFQKGGNITHAYAVFAMVPVPANSTFRAQVNIDNVAGSALVGVTSTYNCAFRCAWQPL